MGSPSLRRRRHAGLSVKPTTARAAVARVCVQVRVWVGGRMGGSRAEWKNTIRLGGRLASSPATQAGSHPLLEQTD